MFLGKPKNIKYSLKVKLPHHDQKIVIGRQLDNFIVQEFITRHYHNSVILVDSNFLKIHKYFVSFLKNQLKSLKIIPVKPYEGSKSFKFLNSILKQCYINGLTRKSCIIAIGGGIVGDIAGFLASIYMRGIDFIFIPTTLMAQADTIINKVAISYKLLKNIVGSFYSPVLTVCDIYFFSTLEKKEISLGFSEVIKHAVIDSRKHFDYLKKVVGKKMDNYKNYPWEDIIYKSLIVKSNLVAKDPLDSCGYHKGLSYGHTFASVLEGISDFKFRHGEAVALGMKFSGLISVKLGYLSDDEFREQIDLLRAVDLPNNLPFKVDKDMILKLLCRDKISHDGKIILVLLKNIGNFFIQKNIDHQLISEVITSFNRR